MGYRITDLENALEHANARGDSNADFWRQRYEEMGEKIEELARRHSKFRMHEANPIDLRLHTTFFCEECRTPWPCDTLRTVTGKDFAPIKLQLREETL